MAESTAVCVDFGSTWTKALHVDLANGDVLGTAASPTVLTDVMDAFDACLESLTANDGRAASAEVFACSSAGGGLRLAVVGNEELVTAEAGRRVALSSGGHVVSVTGRAHGEALGGVLSDSAPDVVLLTGGTDGGNSEALLDAARALAEAGRSDAWRGPVVVAGNVEAQAAVSDILADLPHVLTDNVVPRIGVLEPAGARSAIREMFLAHVIGGKELSPRPEFVELVRGATPDVVLAGVEVLSEVAGDVVVIDVGGATTDVHSVVRIDPEEADLRREVVAVTGVTRTVEGDLGMRWSAATTADAAELPELRAPAERRRADPSFLPGTDDEWDEDEAIARSAVALAVRRHAGRSRVVLGPGGQVVERTGTDLREVALVVGSGGVLRHGRDGVAERVLTWTTAGGWQLPEPASTRVVVDRDYVLAAVGLLAEQHPVASRRLARSLI